MFTVTLNIAKYIEINKDAIKRCPVTSLMYFLRNLLMTITPLCL